MEVDIVEQDELYAAAHRFWTDTQQCGSAEVASALCRFWKYQGLWFANKTLKNTLTHSARFQHTTQVVVQLKLHFTGSPARSAQFLLDNLDES